MGLFGTIGNFLGGGKTSTGYTSKYTPKYEEGARKSVMKRAGARVTGQDSNGNDIYDFSGTSNPVTAGNQGYDMSNLDTAISGFKGPSSYTPSSYTASKFDFASKPDEYYNTEYEIGASDVRREGAGQLQKMQEALGPRRAGLLLKAGSNSQRTISENLAKMRAGLSQEAMREKSDLDVKQQIAQAGENFNAADFNDSQQKYVAEDKFRRNQGLFDAAKGKVGLQSDVTERERAYQDKAMEYLMDMFYKTAGLQGQAADRKNEGRGQNLSFISSLAK